MSFFGNLSSLTDQLDLSKVQKDLTARASQFQANLQAQAAGVAGRIEAVTSEINALVRSIFISWCCIITSHRAKDPARRDGHFLFHTNNRSTEEMSLWNTICMSLQGAICCEMILMFFYQLAFAGPGWRLGEV